MVPVLLSVGALVLYVAGVRRVAREQKRRWPQRRTRWAVLAALVVTVAVSPLLHHGPAGEWYEAAAGHSGHGSDGGLPALPVDPAVAHMVQHLLLGMYAPLLVVLAAPLTLALGAAPLGWRPRLRAVITSRAASVLVHPVVAAVPAVVGMHVLFLTPLYRLSLEHDWLHHLVQAHLLLAGSLLALALVGGDPSPPRSGLLLRLGVLVCRPARTRTWPRSSTRGRPCCLPATRTTWCRPSRPRCGCTTAVTWPRCCSRCWCAWGGTAAGPGPWAAPAPGASPDRACGRVDRSHLGGPTRGPAAGGRVSTGTPTARSSASSPMTT